MTCVQGYSSQVVCDVRDYKKLKYASVGASSINYGTGIQWDILKLLNICFPYTVMVRSKRYIN